MMINRPIPQNVKSMIESLLNEKERIHIRDNYQATLMNIRDQVNAALDKYNKEKAFVEEKMRKRA